jgi:Icc protein
MVVTGDLAEDELTGTYSRSLKFFSEQAFPVYVLPGNHDNLSNMRFAFAGSGIGVMESAELGNWKLLMLNSKVDGKSHGFIERESLRALECELVAASDQPVLIALHHSLTTLCLSSVCQLTNSDELIAFLHKFQNVKLVISGHNHESVSKKSQHISLLTTPSSFGQFWHARAGQSENHEDFWASHKLDSSRHGYRVIDLQENGTFATEVHWVSSVPSVADCPGTDA